MKEYQTLEPIVENVLDNKKLIDDLIHKWGGSISEAIFDSPSSFYQVPDIEGFIGYRLVNGCAVIYGEPVCPPDDKYQLAAAFHSYCKQNNIASIYICVSEDFSKWAIKNHYKISIEVGEDIHFDPFHNPQEGPRGNRLRNRINHALNLGLTVHEYTGNNRSIEDSIQNVGLTWLKARQGPQIHLGDINFFDNRNARRWFYVENKEGRIIGMALLSSLEAYKGWLLKYLMVIPDTPRGTSELLMVTILEKLHQEGCHFITYGMVPSENLGEIIGLGKCSSWMARGAFRMAKWIFHLEQRKLYWQKFHPQTDRSYILFSSPRIGFKEIRALLLGLKIS